MYSSAAAQLPDPSRELELIESTERDEDPLSIDDSTGRALDRAAARVPTRSEPAARPTPRTGEALSAIDGVEERAHALDIRLEQGLAFARVALTFASRARHAAELAYRLPIPAGAVVTEAALCGPSACAEARPETSAHARRTTAPAGLSLAPIEDARGHALSLRIAPLPPSGTLTVRIAYVAPAPVRGGRVQLRVPARGFDPRAAAAEVTLRAPHLRDLTPGEAVTLDATRSLSITARVASSPRARIVTRARCGAHSCVRRYEVRELAAPSARATALWIDASPSMEGPARGQASAVLGTLLSILPEHTPMSALAFAARAEELGRFTAGSAPLALLSDATLRPLGAATRPSVALAHVRDDVARARPRIVVVSDGRFDPAPRERAALESARALGAELWLCELSGAGARVTEPFARSGGVLRASEPAEIASRGGDTTRLEDTLRPITMPLRGGVRAGEERVVEQRPVGRWPRTAGAHWLAHWLLRDEPAPTLRIAAPPGEFVDAVPFTSVLAPEPSDATAMPKESVLSMLRDQLVPAARACLRSDRKGRGNYAVELTFRALFAEREVVDARVDGALGPQLRSCLEDILPRLRVPAFTGAIRVRYPIHTEREAPPPVIALEPEVDRALERALGPGVALP